MVGRTESPKPVLHTANLLITERYGVESLEAKLYSHLKEGLILTGAESPEEQGVLLMELAQREVGGLAGWMSRCSS
ncbi:MAG: uncharacterized protein KVP18_002396 [Porospora cf. gigantea A]|uniref:uncharacterized protein n=1 Tax=Porospora cf. gigantea A TaxID=2853593 RepID=UPI00355AA632|nr:MAG: hypothetical protein KVP18_002396 [Porospora cf. gigantea A]